MLFSGSEHMSSGYVGFPEIQQPTEISALARARLTLKVLDKLVALLQKEISK